MIIDAMVTIFEEIETYPSHIPLQKRSMMVVRIEYHRYPLVMPFSSHRNPYLNRDVKGENQ